MFWKGGGRGGGIIIIIIICEHVDSQSLNVFIVSRSSKAAEGSRKLSLKFYNRWGYFGIFSK